MPTTDPSVAGYFKEVPFASRGGRLRKDKGKEDFVEYSIHDSLLEKIRIAFQRPITIRLLYGNTGAGKTWTMAWLWRKFDEQVIDGHKYLVIAVPRLETKHAPERGMLEALVQAVLNEHPKLIQQAASKANASRELKDIAAYLEDEDGRYVLTGRGASARIPRIEGLPPISTNRAADLQMVILVILEAAKHSGFDRVLILLDELEGPLSLHGRKTVSIFTDFLRDLYDVLEDENKLYPHTHILVGGTTPVAEQFSPEYLNRTIDQGGVLEALLRRVEPAFRLTPPSDREVKNIAEDRIERHRIKQAGKFIPFNEDAIALAWVKSGRNLGQFVQILQNMYDLAAEEGVDRVTTAHCLRVTGAAERGAGVGSAPA